MADFAGAMFHSSARWDHGYDLRGKCVVVGTSAAPFVPEIVGQVAWLDLCQHTAPWWQVLR